MADVLARARTATLLGSVLTALSSGTNYVYSAYAPQLGSRLHITHTQLNIIGLSGNMGVYTTGPILGRITDKRGPRPLLAAAFLLLLTGYTGLRSYYDAGASKEGPLPLSSLIAMSLFSYMTGAGGNSGLTASSNATAKSFPERMRATTVGFVLSGFGLSAFFFSTLANWIFPGNTSSFLLFLSLGTSLPVIIGFLTVRPVPHAERPDAGPGGLTLPPEYEAMDSSTHLLGNGAIPRVIENGIHGMMDGDRDGDGESVSVRHVQPELVSALDVPPSRRPSMELSPARSSSNGPGRRASTSRRPTIRPKMFAPTDPVDIHGKCMLMGWEFWLLFSILSLLSGTGLMYINNVGSISQALSAKGNPDFDQVQAGKLQAAQVSIISLANCAARIGAGASADFVRSRFSAHRSYLLSLISTLFIISQLVASQVENVNHLWQASLLLGLGYGGVFGLLPTVTIEWFGLAHFSENWGFVSLAPLLGGNLFSILFGRILDAHVPTSPSTSSGTSDTASRAPITDPESGHQCLEGRACYAGAMGVTTFACVLALGLSLVAAWWDRRKAAAERGNLGYESVAQEAIWEDEERD